MSENINFNFFYRYPLPRSTICACPDCGEVFPKIESLEHHQAVKHAGKYLYSKNLKYYLKNKYK